MKTLKRKRRLNREEPDIVEAELVEETEGQPEVPVIKVYPKEKCSVCGIRNAVGSGDRCVQCGGEITDHDNLLDDTNPENLPDYFGAVYKPEYHPIAYIKLAREGKSDKEIAYEFGVSVKTMQNWASKFKMFAMAFEMGADYHEAWWMMQGKTNLKNRSFNTGLFKFLTGNIIGWSEKQESKNLNINAGVLLAPKPMTKEEWEAQFAEEN